MENDSQELVDAFLKAIENEAAKNRWHWLTSMEPKEAKKTMTDYDNFYKKESERWSSAEIDNRFKGLNDGMD